MTDCFESQVKQAAYPFEEITATDEVLSGELGPGATSIFRHGIQSNTMHHSPQSDISHGCNSLAPL